MPEVERPVFGLTKNISTYNPLRVATHEYAAIARDVKAAGSWRERGGRVFGGPGWQPKDAPTPVPVPAAGQTTETAAEGAA